MNRRHFMVALGSLLGLLGLRRAEAAAGEPGGYCTGTPVLEINHGPTPDDYTHSCLAHLGEMITDAEIHTLYEAPEGSRCCYAGRA